jgi:predicted nucleic acid-binding protein
VATPAASLYLDTSAVLRAVLEAGTTPDMERSLRNAPVLLTSRLSLVESSRALIRARTVNGISAERLADTEREIDGIWARCEVWELTRGVCELARHVASNKPLRTLDALHLATFLLARRKVEGLVLLTADERLRDAASRA